MSRMPAAARRAAPIVLLAALVSSPALAHPEDPPGALAPLQVVSTSPARYAVHVAPTLSTIEVTFSDPPVIPEPAAVRVVGNMSGPHAVAPSVAGNVLTLTVSGAWLPGDVVSVNLRSDITGASSDALTGGHFFAFTIASGSAPAEWSEPVVYPAASVPYFLFGGDLDGDGTPDLAVPNEGTHDVSVWRNPSGDGSLSPRLDYGVGNTPSSVFGEDLNNDGHLDLASADISSGTVSVLLNQGGGTFAPSVPYAAGGTTRQVDGADFDGDNDVDLVASSFTTDQVFYYENLGDGSFAAGVAYTDVPDGPFALKTADVNEDGWVDLAVGCQNADSLVILLNQGDGTLVRAFTKSVGDGIWDLVGNDLNGDGHFDLVGVTSFNNRIQVYAGAGDGTFGQTGSFAGFFPLGVHVADLDGDGDIDAMSANFNSGTVGVYRNDGAGNLTLDVTLPVERSGSYVWAHDLDLDGDLDLSVVDELSDSLYVFFNEPVTSSPEVDRRAASRLWAQPNPARGGDAVSLVVGDVGDVATLEVFGVDGRRIRTLHRGPLPVSRAIAWDGRGASGRLLPTGAYLVRVRGNAGEGSTVVRWLR